MADNVQLNAGAGGAVLATDDDGVAQHQYVKVEFGADNTFTKVSTTVGLPADVLDRAARDLGKVDVAGLDQYTPVDADTGVGTDNVLPVSLRVAASGGSIAQTYGAGVVDAGTQRVNLASDQATVAVSLATVPSHAVTNVGTFAVQVSAALPTGANSIGVVDTELPAAAVLADTTANPTVPAVGTLLHVFNGTTWDRTRGDITNGLDVDVTRLPALVAGTANIGDVDVLTLPALVAGTANIGDVDVLTLPALPAGTNNIGDVDIVTGPTGATALATQGTVAHDGVDAQNPVGVGYRAIAHGTNPTAVAAADRTVGYANRAGVPFIIGGHPNIVTIELAATAAQTDVAIVTIAGGLKIAVTQIQMTADNANTVDVGFRVGFGAVNTPTTTGVVLTHPGVAAGSGISRGDGSGILGVGADGEDLRVTSEVPTTGSIRILVSYFTIES